MKKKGTLMDKSIDVKSHNIKRITAAAVAVLLASAVVVTSVFNRSKAAENADTLMGIEKLRNRMAKGGEYTILEIVPDINAAEIGYLFDGYEPMLSEWDPKTMTWRSWKDVLCSINDKDERIEFIESRKTKLKEYFAKIGLEDNFPVVISDEVYDDSEEYKSGFEPVQSGSYEKKGYFTPDGNGESGYYVSFKYATDSSDSEAVYYTSADVHEITEAFAPNISNSAYIYKSNGTIYDCVGTWGEYKDILFPSSGGSQTPGNSGDADQSEEEQKDGDSDSNDTTGDFEDGNNEDANSGNDTQDSGSDTQDSGSDTQDSGSDAGESDSADDADNNKDEIGVSTGSVVGESFSQIKWFKFVSMDSDNIASGAAENDSNKTGDSQESSGESSSDTGSNEDSGDSQGSNSGDSGNVSGGGSGNEENNDSDEGGDNGPGEGQDNGDDNQGGNSGDSGNGSDGGSDDGQNSDSGDNSGNNSGDSGNKQEDPSDSDKDAESGDGDDTDDGSEEEPDDEDTDSGEEDDDKKDDSSDDEKDTGFGKNKPQSVTTKAQSDKYYFVNFRKVTGTPSSSDVVYTVKQIMPAGYGETGQNLGVYYFVESDDGQIYTLPGRVLYCKGVFHNNEWFKQYVINMNKDNFDDFNVKVITMTPDDLNNIYENGTDEYAQGTLPEFDFLYLNSGLRASQIDVGDGDLPPIKDVPDNSIETGTGDDDDTTEPGEGDDSNQAEPGEGDDGNQAEPGEGDDGNQAEPGEGDDGNQAEPGTDDGGSIADPGTGDGSSQEESGDANGDENSTDSNDSGTTDNTGNTGNSNNNADNSSDTDTPLAAQYTSAWRTYVSKDDSDTAGSASSDKSAETGSATAPSASDEKAETAEKNETTSDTSDNADNANNSDSTDNTDNVDSTDNTTNPDNTDDTANLDNADGEDTAGDASEPNDSDEATDGDTPADSDETDTPDSSEPSTDSDNNNSSYSEHPVTVYNTANIDLKNSALTNMLYNKVAANALPCLVDGSILYSKAEGGATTDKSANTENTEIFRLAAMLCQPTLETDVTNVSKEKLLEGIKDGDKNFTTEQVYCRLGDGKDSIINDNFFKFTIYEAGKNNEVEEGFQNVLDEINLENLYRESDTSGQYKALSTNISQAEAVRHIINYQNRRNVDTKKKIKVLEIQPAYTTEPELNLKQIQKWAPGVEEVETTIMTTSEFIGHIEKINEIYDLVYIGTSKEHLNISNWITDTGISTDKNNKYLGSTVYNDSNMDGLIYSNIGDKRVVGLPLSGLLDSEYKSSTGWTYYYNFVRYSGNDITKEKKDALLSFLDGSYPIVVSDEFIEQPVTVFEDTNFAGRRATLGEGSYTEQDLLNNQIYVGANKPAKGISSIQVKKGYQITLYSNPDYTGEYITLTEDEKVLSNYATKTKQSWDNLCRSIVVEKIENAQPVKAIDGNHIDNSSYLYEFVNTALVKKYTNFYAKGDIDETGSEIFKFYLNRPKATLIDFTANGFLGGDVSGSTDDADRLNDVYYIYPNTIGKYTLQFNFTIQNEGAASTDTKYNCKLYIDVNADGKFSEYEEISDIVMQNRQTGNGVSIDELYAGTPYTVVREVPTGYKGLLPWKIEVCQINNDNIYASKQGYTKLQNIGDAEIIKVCQITKNPESGKGHQIINLQDELEKYTDSYFYTLYQGIKDDFILDVTTITIDDFEKYFDRNYNEVGEDGTVKKYNPDYLHDFNMLILGFSDNYNDFNGSATDPNTPIGAIVEFINTGKSVLMSHDVTSYFNNPLQDGTMQGYTDRTSNSLTGTEYTRSAANINKYIRPLVGMDRYGVLNSSVVKRGVALSDGQGGWSSLFDSGKEVAYKPKSARKETVPEAHGYTYTIINARDTKYNKEQHDKQYTEKEVGMTFRNDYLNLRYDTCYYKNAGTGSSKEASYDDGEITANTSGKVANLYVTQVNKGQITQYPYKLEESFEVAMTHAQYYQLDYTADDDKDGQSDLVVWYCLGGREQSADKDTIYSQSPNDVRNNYYIYNKGNITYTGMGHGGNEKSDYGSHNGYTYEEAKLFINTIIASYQAGVKPPTITVLESGSPDAAQLTTMYRYYDEKNMVSLADIADTDTHEKVYFTVRDLNFVNGNRKITTHAYYHIDGVWGSNTISVNGEEISVNPIDDWFYNASTGQVVGADELESGEIYYLMVPKTVLSQCENGLDIYFEAQSLVTTNTTTVNEYRTDKIYAKLQVLRAYLFELD